MDALGVTSEDTIEAIIARLDKVDWRFENLSSRGHVTSLHPYPARFIPSIPRAIIEAIKPFKPDLRILDPFAGCGTVLAEGLMHNCEVAGIDVNGLAHFLQKAYTTNITESHLREFKQLINTIQHEALNEKLIPQHHADIPNLSHWFEKDAVALISNAIAIVEESKSPEVRQLALLSISRALVSLSRQKSDTQYVAVDKGLLIEQKLALLVSSLNAVAKFYANNQHLYETDSQCIFGDARDASSYKTVKKINLVVTSPPYPNAYEYWLYHKYRMYWMGLDPIWSRTNEIGVRPHYSGSGKKDEWDFYRDITAVMANITEVTTDDALQFWVVGDSIIKGRAIDNTKIVVDAAKELGWSNIATYQRPINRKRSSFQGIGKKLHEDVIVLKKQ